MKEYQYQCTRCNHIFSIQVNNKNVLIACKDCGGVLKRLRVTPKIMFTAGSIFKKR